MRHDSSIQFNLAPPPSPPQPPQWLKSFFDWLGDMLAPVGRFLSWVASVLPGQPYAKILLFTVIALGGAILLWALYNRLRYKEWRLPFSRPGLGPELHAEQEWAPEIEGARSWLEEADALAGEGRFAEAIHHLLFRSIDDIASRRPALVRPALTSRELAASTLIPARARQLFSSIAALVEQSLFGARPVSEDEWRQAREAYSVFALPSAWRL